MTIQRKNWSSSSNTLATWCKETAHWKRSWCWERLKAKGEQHRMRWLDSITDSADMNLSKLQETVKDSQGQRSLACSHDATEHHWTMYVTYIQIFLWSPWWKRAASFSRFTFLRGLQVINLICSFTSTLLSLVFQLLTKGYFYSI